MVNLRVQAPRVVYDDFFVNGMVARTIYDPGRSWAERLAEAAAALVALAPLVDVAWAQHAIGFTDWSGLTRGPPPLPGTRESDLRYHRHLLTCLVPDARGALVVTDAHLERAADLRRWSCQALGGGRHLLAAPELAPWFAQAAPDPEVLAAARADFGAMVLRRQDLAPTLPPPPAR